MKTTYGNWILNKKIYFNKFDVKMMMKNSAPNEAPFMVKIMNLIIWGLENMICQVVII